MCFRNMYTGGLCLSFLDIQCRVLEDSGKIRY